MWCEITLNLPTHHECCNNTYSAVLAKRHTYIPHCLFREVELLCWVAPQVWVIDNSYPLKFILRHIDHIAEGNSCFAGLHCYPPSVLTLQLQLIDKVDFIKLHRDGGFLEWRCNNSSEGQVHNSYVPFSGSCVHSVVPCWLQSCTSVFKEILSYISTW